LTRKGKEYKKGSFVKYTLCYYFDIIFRKLEEAKKKQDQIGDVDFILSEEIHEHIRELKEFYDDTTQERETYTRT